jgi:branched-chain amino acid transport system substrate-binding protein
MTEKAVSMSFALHLSAACLAFGLAGSALAADGAVVLGETLALSGRSAKIADALLKGRMACVDWVNRQGGIGGRALKLVTRDDAGDPQRAAANVRALIDEERAVAILGPMGPAISQAVLPLANSAQIAIVAPFGGDIGSRARVPEGVYFVTANQSAEAERLAAHVTALGLKRLVIVHSADASGQSALVALEEGLGVVNVPPVVSIAVKPDGSDATEVVRAIGAAGAQAVLLATIGTSTSAMLQALSSANGSTGLLQVYGLSASASLADLAVLGKAAQGYSMTQVLPSPGDSRLALAASFREAMRDAAGNASHVEMEGCLSVLATVEVLRRRSTEATRTGVWRAFKAGGVINVGGFEIDLSDRAKGSRFTDIVYIGAGGKTVR